MKMCSRHACSQANKHVSCLRLRADHHADPMLELTSHVFPTKQLGLVLRPGCFRRFDEKLQEGENHMPMAIF